jgi:NhaP-type Na+/H+ or K+/H+ antiporter
MNIYTAFDLLLWAIAIGICAGACLGTFLFFCLKWMEKKGLIKIE